MAGHYAEGSRAPIIQGLEIPVELRPLSLVMEEVDSLLRNGLTDNNLEYALGGTSRAMHVLAAGEAGILWIEDPADLLAHRITMRHSVLLVTASELDVATRKATAGTLD